MEEKSVLLCLRTTQFTGVYYLYEKCISALVRQHSIYLTDFVRISVGGVVVGFVSYVIDLYDLFSCARFTFIQDSLNASKYGMVINQYTTFSVAKDG